MIPMSAIVQTPALDRVTGDIWDVDNATDTTLQTSHSNQDGGQARDG
jgi:hypothetical protein